MLGGVMTPRERIIVAITPFLRVPADDPELNAQLSIIAAVYRVPSSRDLLVDLLKAVDEKVVNIEGPMIDGGDPEAGGWPWTEEWLHHARAAVAVDAVGLSPEQYDNLIRDAMLWRSCAPDILSAGNAIVRYYERSLNVGPGDDPRYEILLWRKLKAAISRATSPETK